ncbi:glycosyltransferase [Halosquirtibacter laminarini]|uniref:Glycosyltransferase n=1 Tax=Halosquirtibacter laminarini TaxID=3374600 RepID=A0AC61NE51_9BACT|nr:glycosyltransferase [Prolixibacteraceae bacterium]
MTDNSVTCLTTDALIDKEGQIEISVLMAVYNEEICYIQEAVDSILNQTFSSFEFIIVNDNPLNLEIKEFVCEINDPRVRIIENSKNLGLAQSLNVGIEIARGRYIARMDADDISFPTRLEKQYHYLEQNKQIDILGTQLKKFGESNRFWINLIEPEEINAKLFFKCCLAHPTVMIRLSIFKEYDLFYDATDRASEDYNLWCRAFRYVNMVNLPEVLLYYRVHKQQVTQVKSKMQQDCFAKSHLILLNNILDSMSAKEIELSRYIWQKGSIYDVNDIGLFENLIRRIIKNNREKKIYNPLEFEAPLVMILINRIKALSLTSYLLLAEVLFKNGIIKILRRKWRKRSLVSKIKKKFNNIH